MTFAKYIGRAIGYTAATTVHAACVTASYTGEFGKDLLDSTVDGYVDNSARLAAKRAEYAVAPRSIAVTTVRKAKATA